METIINQTCEKLNSLFMNFFSENHSLDDAEKYFGNAISEATVVLLGAYYEELDRRLKEEKEYRKTAGLTVHKNKVQRCQLISLGEIRYNRTYYRLKDGTYDYPIDSIAGIEPYQRISNGISQSLANVAVKHSYSDASKYVTGGAVSKQTVMNKIRASKPLQQPVACKSKISELHIDADEDHVSLQNKKHDVCVPSITVYEGITSVYKSRNKCKNAFGISEYGVSSEEIWEEVYDEIDKRYDIEHCRIYVHGDGAAWIKQASNVFPKCIFVLDPYHRNKYKKTAVSGMVKEDGEKFIQDISEVLKNGTIHDLMCIQGEMVSRYPDRIETILEGTNYLLNNFESIQVYYNDPMARNGGATEPHVSHMLSSRLSSRPLGWSEETLKKIAPILAAGNCYYDPREEYKEVSKTKKAINSRMILHDGIKKRFVSNSISLPHPDFALTEPIFDQTNKRKFSRLTSFWI